MKLEQTKKVDTVMTIFNVFGIYYKHIDYFVISLFPRLTF